MNYELKITVAESDKTPLWNFPVLHGKPTENVGQESRSLSLDLKPGPFEHKGVFPHLTPTLINLLRRSLF